jgi:hypothetical protein
VYTMPLTNLYLRAPNGRLELITPRELGNPDHNIFDKAFNANMDVDETEWNDWMRWDGAAAQLDTLNLDRKLSNASTISSPETWTSDLESSGRGAISASFSVAENDFSFEDAHFELDENSRSLHGLQLGPSERVFESHIQIPQDLRRSFHAYSSLTEAEEQSLQEIAMPQLSHIKISSEPSSPLVSHYSPSPSPSPEAETRTRKTKKRKPSIDDEDVPIALSQSRKRGHNAIEKRYRTNLNDKINCLREGVPALSKSSSSEMKSGDECEDSDAEGVDVKTGQQKYGKAAILTRALEYIKHLENTTQRLGKEVTGLKTRVNAFEKLAMNGSMALSDGPAVRSDVTLTAKCETLQSIKDGKKSPSIAPHHKLES